VRAEEALGARCQFQEVSAAGWKKASTDAQTPKKQIECSSLFVFCLRRECLATQTRFNWRENNWTRLAAAGGVPRTVQGILPVVSMFSQNIICTAHPTFSHWKEKCRSSYTPEVNNWIVYLLTKIPLLSNSDKKSIQLLIIENRFAHSNTIFNLVK
jgi:hypothetical protein